MAEKILIIGSTGYVGKFIAKASVALGYPTWLLVRPTASSDKAKAEFLDSIKSSGAHVVHGDLTDHDSLVAAIKQVDVVISVVSPFFLDQLKIVAAIKEAGGVKRFLPSEFGVDPAKLKDPLPQLLTIVGQKLEVRKAVEEAGIPYTYVATNGFAGYFLNTLGNLARFLQGILTPPRDKATIWGDGNVKAIYVDENDIGTYAIKAAVDPRTLNKTVYFRPPKNILTQNELVAIWEKLIGKTLEKTYVPEKDIVKNIEETPFPGNALPALEHSIFVKGDQYGFDVEYETSELYPDVKYTSVEEYLSRLV